MFYQGKITAQDSRYGSYQTKWYDTKSEAETASEKTNTEKYQGTGKVEITESPEKLIELAGPFTRKYFKYQYFKTDLKTGKNKSYIMDSEMYNENLLGMFDYQRRVDDEHQDNIRGLMHAYCNQSAIGYEMVYC